MKLLRAAALGAGLLALLALLAAWQGPRFLDWDRYRGAVERVTSTGIGRPVQIAGPIRLALLPEAILRAGDVRVADTGDGASATIGELRIRVGLRALLTGRVEPQDLVLQDARMRLPWPLAGFALHGTPPPGGLHARVEDGTLLLGGLQISRVSGDLSAGGPETALSASGLASVLGRPWRMTGRLGRPGSDGSATVEISLDGQDAGVGTGAALTGQVAADGSVSGRVTGRGPDLSLLLPAPAQAWSADGRLVAGSGLVVADDLELTIGGSPARGAVALRLLPQLRLDAALATNRLDLDAWLPPLLHGGPVPLPTGIDLSAEAASLAGGTLRRLRAGFELTGSGVSLRDAEAVLPGEAEWHLSGVLTGRRFEGGARLVAPDFAQTLAWLKPRAPALIDAVPPGTLQTATLVASVQADGDTVMFDGLQGDVDGVPLTGTLGLRGGARPAVAASLHLTGPVLDRWAPVLPDGMAQAAARLDAAARWAAGFDVDATVNAERPVWHGTVLDSLTIDGSAHGGMLELRQAALTGPALAATLSGSLDTALRVTDGKLGVQLANASLLGDRLPPAWQFARPLFQGPVLLSASVTGPTNAWVTMARAEMADTRLRMEGKWDFPGRHWSGAVLLHHPGAPRLFSSLGLAGLVGWLGDGSFSLQAGMDAAIGRVALAGFKLSAGGLHGTGDLALAWPGGAVPALTGAVDIDQLSIPLPYLQSTNPLDLDALHALDATVAVHTDHLLWGGSPPGVAASARIGLSGGVLHVADITAGLGGGALAGQIMVDAGELPRMQAKASLTGAVVDGSVFGTALDLIAGVADGTVDLTATGYSPAALLGSLQGPVRATIRNGALAGFDAAELLSILQGAPASAASGPDTAALRSAAAQALSHAATLFTQMEVAGGLAGGLFTLDRASAATPSAAIAGTGYVDLPGGTLDLSLTLQPTLDGAPAIGLRLIGPASRPDHVVGLAGLTRWLAAR